MRRVAALVLAIMFSISIVLPLVDSSAHKSNRPGVHRHRGHRHSRAWWRRYRARLKRQRAVALARRRALVAQRGHNTTAPAVAPDIERPILPSAATVVGSRANDARSTNGLLMPERRSTTPMVVNGQTQFRLYGQNGQAVGQAALSPVNTSPVNVAALNARTQRRQLAGVPFADLRRQVIEKMIAGNGWVINDMEREINGHRVFIVVAQTAASSDGRTPAQTWNFYFTEIDGRIYSLASHAPVDMMEQMAAESEKVIATLPTSNRSVLAEKANR
ncbi:MAG: hypothetical protein ICV68_11020 [Pyrinomonadaceae bacterium]|nr:hypothetical protein [Pyrinomonadaceae bacterium]